MRRLIVIGIAVATLGAAVQGAAAEEPAPSPPGARTTHAYALKTNAAVLLGFINPHGARTTFFFQIGRTTSYGRTYPPGAPEHFFGRSSPIEVEQAVNHLQPGTTYHFRLVATSDGGTAYGKGKTFRTRSRNGG